MAIGFLRLGIPVLELPQKSEVVVILGQLPAVLKLFRKLIRQLAP
jgi:hypothetical protein